MIGEKKHVAVQVCDFAGEVLPHLINGLFSSHGRGWSAVPRLCHLAVRLSTLRPPLSTAVSLMDTCELSSKGRQWFHGGTQPGHAGGISGHAKIRWSVD